MEYKNIFKDGLVKIQTDVKNVPDVLQLIVVNILKRRLYKVKSYTVFVQLIFPALFYTCVVLRTNGLQNSQHNCQKLK